MPPPQKGFLDFVASYEENVEELDEVIVRLLEPEPGQGDVGQTIFIENIDSIEVTPRHGGDLVPLVTDYYLDPFEEHGHGGVVDVDGEQRDYSEEVYDKVRWTFAPPVLWNEGGKLQREWFYQFLLDPVTLREQLRVRMPTFDWGDGEAGAVADYFANLSHREWPARYARKLLIAREQTAEELATEMIDAGLRTNADVVQGIVDGQTVETTTGFDALLAFGSAHGFEFRGRVDPSYEAIPQRSPAVVADVLDAQPDFFSKVHDMVVQGPNCVQCHFLRGAPPTQDTPLAWAPDLDLTRARLRPEWVRAWLTDPSRIYPGTSMPANFPADQEQWQEFYPAASREQIEAVLMWLYNLDQAVRD
jgi:mono/diheme cytochrome c family protein